MAGQARRFLSENERGEEALVCSVVAVTFSLGAAGIVYILILLRSTLLG